MCFEIRCRYKPVSRLPTLQTLWKKPHSASCAVDENIDSGMLNEVADAKSEYIFHEGSSECKSWSAQERLQL